MSDVAPEAPVLQGTSWLPEVAGRLGKQQWDLNQLPPVWENLSEHSKEYYTRIGHNMVLSVLPDIAEAFADMVIFNCVAVTEQFGACDDCAAIADSITNFATEAGDE